LLQAPVLDMKQPLAAQYGSFGAMLGHELTSAIDPAGRRIDAAGTLRDWWSAGTAGAWETRVGPLAAQYSRFSYPGNAALKVDGARTRAVNAADLSGLELALAAWEKAEPDAKQPDRQAFFRGWGRLWTQQLSAPQAAAHAAGSPYPPGQWRANGPLMQMPGFATAFGCKAGNAMLVPQAEQVSIWR
jgi:putative endopeptidase